MAHLSSQQDFLGSSVTETVGSCHASSVCQSTLRKLGKDQAHAPSDNSSLSALPGFVGCTDSRLVAPGFPVCRVPICLPDHVTDTGLKSEN